MTKYIYTCCHFLLHFSTSNFWTAFFGFLLNSLTTILKIVSLNMLLEAISDMLSWRTCIKVVSLAWFQQILWLAGSPAWVWGGLCDEHICICMVMMVCYNNENYQAKNSQDHAYASCWQMLKKKLILCHVTLNLPVTLVTWKIPNIMLRNVPVFVPMLTSVAVRSLIFVCIPQLCNICTASHIQHFGQPGLWRIRAPSIFFLKVFSTLIWEI